MIATMCVELPSRFPSDAKRRLPVGNSRPSLPRISPVALDNGRFRQFLAAGHVTSTYGPMRDTQHPAARLSGEMQGVVAVALAERETFGRVGNTAR